MKAGDRLTARRYAERAAVLAPQTEEPWLLLSYLASPKAAQYYLDRALQANPTSQRALTAQAWLNQQLISSSSPAVSVPSEPAAVPDFAAEPDAAVTQEVAVQSELAAKPDAAVTQEVAVQPTAAVTQELAVQPASIVTPEPAGRRQPGPKFPRVLRYMAILGVAVAVLVGLISLNGAAQTAESQDNKLAQVVKTVLNSAATQEPTLTPSLTWTAAPTATLAATATNTASPVPTDTAFACTDRNRLTLADRYRHAHRQTDRHPLQSYQGAFQTDRYAVQSQPGCEYQLFGGPG